MTTLTLFNSKARQMGYVFRSGKTIYFKDHKYATDDKDEIEELTKTCDKSPLGVGNYYIDPARLTIESEELADPYHLIREQIRAEEIAKLRANDITKDGGTYEQGKINPTNSSQVYVTSAQTAQQAAAIAGANAAANAGTGDSPAGFVKVNIPKA